MPSSVRGIDHIGITVPDIEKATLFLNALSAHRFYIILSMRKPIILIRPPSSTP